MTLHPPWANELWSGILGAAGSVELPSEWSELPAIGRLTVSRPQLLEPFEDYNRRNPDARVRPGSFVSVAYPKTFSTAEDIRLFAPFINAPKEAFSVEWFDMRTGRRLRITTRSRQGLVEPGLVSVKSYAEVAREYAAHPESKFLGPDGAQCLRTTTGVLQRRPVTESVAQYIGKEGNMLDRRAEGCRALAEAQQIYTPDDYVERIAPALKDFSAREIAGAAGVSTRAARNIKAGRSIPRSGGREALAVLVSRSGRSIGAEAQRRT